MKNKCRKNGVLAVLVAGIGLGVSSCAGGSGSSVSPEALEAGFDLARIIIYATK